MHPFPFVVFYFWQRLIQALILIIIIMMMMMKVEIVLNTESSNSNEYLFGYLLGQQISYACRTEAKTRHIAQVNIA